MLTIILALLFGINGPAGMPSALAQIEQVAEPEDPEPVIEAVDDPVNDQAIADRISSIFAEIEGLSEIQVAVDSGVVALSGILSSQEDIDRAKAIAQRVAGVVTVESNLDRDVSVDTNLAPAVGSFMDDFRHLLRALPLVGIALLIAIAIGLLGHLIASAERFWNKVASNVFLAELIATSIRVIFVGIGIFVALDIVNATAVLGAFLGGAGVIGLAVGFALRDTVDNYVSSIMLSIRQPFRANDHVLIGDQEGRVVRLTSRATILMTLDGNHLRIPNATVFKAQILNYTRNPERRFSFELGVDADDDPAAAVETGLKAINALPFVLDSPDANAVIREVGDSNIILSFHGWVDQTGTDFLKARGAAIRAAKNALEEHGFALPEPIYRLRFDNGLPIPSAPDGVSPNDSFEARSAGSSKKLNFVRSEEAINVDPDDHVEKLVDNERSELEAGDLLDSKQPVE